MKIRRTTMSYPSKLFLSSLALILTPLAAQSVYQESNGVIVMEAERTQSPLGLWVKRTELAGYRGDGYLEFTGNDHHLGPAMSPLVYHFKVNRTGTYVLDLRCAKIRVNGQLDLANDCYVRVLGNYQAVPGEHDIPGNPASLFMLKTDLKYFGGGVDEWEWAAGDAKFAGGRLDPGGKNNKRKATYQFKAGETYTLVVSGRSKSYRLDSIVFRNVADHPDAGTIPASHSESALAPGRPPVADDMDAWHSATRFAIESHPADPAIVTKGAGVVEAIRDASWICYQGFDFGPGNGGAIDIEASSDAAGGRVELHLDSPDGTLIGSVAIRKTWRLGDFTIFSGNVAPVSGKRDLYLVFKGSGERLFNVKQFVFRSGEREQDKPERIPVRPPAGRVAYVADGNSPDPDDLGGTAAALAMLRVVGLDHRLVHASHSCDLVPASNISPEKELERQTLMQAACDETARLWGGFRGLTFWNCRTQQEQAVNDLKDHINASSAEDPLWIVEAGEPDIIGYALKAADAANRQHVKLVTHHPVNDGSGDFFKWGRIEELVGEVIRIPDQNGGSYADIRKGLQRPLWAFHWARDHDDPRIRWLWEQVRIAEEDNVVAFQKGKCDISDAGMMFYWITGANVNGGYRTPTMDDVIDLFDQHL
jgi:hypothetical protein